MTTMQISDSDRQMIYESVTSLLCRRKQLVPWPFDLEETQELYMPRSILDARKKITNRYPYLQGVFAHKYEQKVKVDNVIPGRLPILRIHYHRPELWADQHERDKFPVLKSSPHYARFREWAVAAAKVQLVNEHVGDTLHAALKGMTTYKQLYKALPETMLAINQHRQLPRQVRTWTYRNNGDKLKKVLEELKAEGASRARNLPPEVAEQVRKHKHVIEQTMAMAVLLEDHDGLSKGTPFDDTWWQGRLK